MFCGNGVGGITLTKWHYIALHYIYVVLSWSKSSIPQGQSLNWENNLRLFPDDTKLYIFKERADINMLEVMAKMVLSKSPFRAIWMTPREQCGNGLCFSSCFIKLKYGISTLLLHCRWIELFPSMTLYNGYANWKIGITEVCAVAGKKWVKFHELSTWTVVKRLC